MKDATSQLKSKETPLLIVFIFELLLFCVVIIHIIVLILADI